MQLCFTMQCVIHDVGLNVRNVVKMVAIQLDCALCAPSAQVRNELLHTTVQQLADGYYLTDAIAKETLGRRVQRKAHFPKVKRETHGYGQYSKRCTHVLT